MKNIIKSILDTTDISYIEVIEDLLSTCTNITDKEMEYLEFIIKSYNDLGQTPTETIIIQNFPELEVTLTNSKKFELNDLLYYVKDLINKRKAKMASLSVMDIASKIEKSGLSEGDIENLREFIPDTVDIINQNAYDFTYFKPKYKADKDKPTGLLTGVEQVDELIGGLTVGTMNTILAYTSQFKCVNQHERIPTDRGMLKIRNIYNLVKKGSTIKVLSEEGYRDVTHVHYEGLKDSIIVSINGRDVETSPVHRFRVYRCGELQWVEARDLIEGDLVALKYDECFGYESIDENLAYLLGALTAHGGLSANPDNYDYHYKVNLPVDNIYNTPLDDIFNNLFSSYTKKDRGNHSLYRASINKLKCDYKRYFSPFINSNTSNKKIPSYVFEFDKDSLKHYLKGIFDLTACNSSNKYISVSSNSYHMLNDLTKVLAMFKIKSSIYRVNRKSFRLQILPDDCNIYLNQIGFSNQFKISNKSSYVYKTNLIPCQLGIHNYMKSNNIVNSKISRAIANPSRVCVSYKKLIKYVNNVPWMLDIPFIKEIFSNNLSFGSITKLSRGKSIMYDLTVDGSPTYILSGCVTHNTTWGANILYNNVYNLGYNCAVISLEVPREDYLYNVLGRHSSDSKFSKYPFISHEKIRRHTMSSDEEDYLLNEVLDDFTNNSKGQLFILDETDFKNMSYTEIRETLYKVDDICFEKTGSGLDCILIDHAHLLKFTDNANSRGKSEAGLVNDYISFFRRLTLKFRKTDMLDANGHPVYRQLCSILLAQSNRTGFENACKKKGQYSMLAIAEFNEIERASYRIFSIWTDDILKEAKEALVCVLKNRSGSTQYTPMTVFADGEAYVFGDSDSNGDSTSLEISDNLDVGDFDDLLGGDFGLL